jgi:hypothetical protein
MDTTSRTRVRVIALLGALLCLALAPSAWAAGADNPKEPEHVAEALSEITHGHFTGAAQQLREAIDNRREPAEARGHAREALSAIRHHRFTSARAHARRGAAVEHFTYAQRELEAGDRAGAEDHLHAAEHIAGFGDDARKAIAEIEAGDDNGAHQAADDAIGHANGDDPVGHANGDNPPGHH